MSTTCLVQVAICDNPGIQIEWSEDCDNPNQLCLVVRRSSSETISIQNAPQAIIQSPSWNCTSLRQPSQNTAKVVLFKHIDQSEEPPIQAIFGGNSSTQATYVNPNSLRDITENLRNVKRGRAVGGTRSLEKTFPGKNSRSHTDFLTDQDCPRASRSQYPNLPDPSDSTRRATSSKRIHKLRNGGSQDIINGRSRPLKADTRNHDKVKMLMVKIKESFGEQNLIVQKKHIEWKQDVSIFWRKTQRTTAAQWSFECLQDSGNYDSSRMAFHKLNLAKIFQACKAQIQRLGPFGRRHETICRDIMIGESSDFKGSSKTERSNRRTLMNKYLRLGAILDRLWNLNQGLMLVVVPILTDKDIELVGQYLQEFTESWSGSEILRIADIYRNVAKAILEYALQPSHNTSTKQTENIECFTRKRWMSPQKVRNDNKRAKGQEVQSTVVNHPRSSSHETESRRTENDEPNTNYEALLCMGQDKACDSSFLGDMLSDASSSRMICNIHAPGYRPSGMTGVQQSPSGQRSESLGEGVVTDSPENIGHRSEAQSTNFEQDLGLDILLLISGHGIQGQRVSTTSGLEPLNAPPPTAGKNCTHISAEPWPSQTEMDIQLTDYQLQQQATEDNYVDFLQRNYYQQQQQVAEDNYVDFLQRSYYQQQQQVATNNNVDFLHGNYYQQKQQVTADNYVDFLQGNYYQQQQQVTDGNSYEFDGNYLTPALFPQ